MLKNKTPELLLMSRGSAFMVNSLEMNIKKCKINVTRCEPTVRDFDEYSGGKDIVLIFAGEYLDDSSGLFSYISSKCQEETIYPCLVGYLDELTVMEKYFSAFPICLKVPRPVEMSKFTADINKLVDRVSMDRPKPEEEEKVAGTPEIRHSILMIDDDMMFLKMVQEWLQKDYEITILKSGLMAIAYALHNTPELILLDYEMPEMSGPQVLETLRADETTARIPVVFLTGHSDKNSVMEVLKMRPQGYMLKSTQKEDILASISNFFSTGQWKSVQK
ncbi:MAG: response regulator [Lachnospiraceae bacterium]|nr:response regulator [Lachnospiraceae bacterium]